MRDDDDAYAVDVDVEIAGLELEIEDISRDQRFAKWVGTVIIIGVIVIGPRYLDQTGVVALAGAVAVVSGIKEHLWRNRSRQAHDQMVALKLWAQAEHQNGRRAMRIVRSVDALSDSR